MHERADRLGIRDLQTFVGQPAATAGRARLGHGANVRGVEYGPRMLDRTRFLTGGDDVEAELTRDGGTGIVTRGRSGWTFEYNAESRDAALSLLKEAVEIVSQRGGTTWQLWLSAPLARDDEAAALVGLTPQRDLLQLRIDLPRPEAVTIATRPFRVGEDNDAWLDLNNRAFAWHPEQSNWTVADLDKRFGQPWFDADGFLVYEVDGKMVGFCWTKRHDEYDPPLGEIYVIAKDATAGEPGLGKQLTLAGLAYLASTGLAEGMLYVDATNTKALDMYLAMGFTLHHVDRNYTGVATPTSAPTP